MSLRGKAAIVGFGELPTVRFTPGRTTMSLLSEASLMAIRDAGLRKEDIDGLVTRGEEVNALTLSEHMRLKPIFCEGTTLHGASGAFSVALATMAVASGLANNVLCTFGGSRDPGVGGFSPGERRSEPPPSIQAEWEEPFGPVIAQNGGYGMIKMRHMYQYGSKDEQFAKMAANQRFNALLNPNSAFRGQAISVQDVLNSRYVNEPLHLLESVMPCAGAGAIVVTSAERAHAFSNPPVYVLGIGGASTNHDVIWQETEDITVTAVTRTAPRAFNMAGYSPKDMQFAEFYD